MAKRSAQSGRTSRRIGISRRPPAAPVAQPIRYVESSALAGGPARTRPSREGGPARGRPACDFRADLAESGRAIVRARTAGRLTPAEEVAAVRALEVFARRCDVVAVTEAILVRTGRPFPVEPIRTLDAVHLATAEALGEAPQLVTIVTRDTRVRAAVGGV